MNHNPFFFLFKCLVLCFRLHFAKDTTIGNTAGATVRQLVSLVFERVVIEDAHSNEEVAPKSNESFTDGSELNKQQDLKSLKPFALDAFSLFQVENRNSVQFIVLSILILILSFQDLILLVSGDQPLWLVGMTEMTRTFGIELLENILSTFYSVFLKVID